MILLAFAIAITVDDLPSHGPDPADRVAIARQLVATFQKHGLPPVYGFVNASKLDARPELQAVLDVWRTAGNPLGNHGYSHLSLNTTPVDTYLADIARNERPWMKHVFRYPFLFEGDTLEKRHAVRDWLAQHKYAIAQVSIDADDWAWNPAYTRCAQQHDEATLGRLRHTFLDAHVQMLAFYTELARRLEGRDIAHILLLHIGAMDADQLDALLSTIEAMGGRFVTLEQALKDPVYANAPELAWKAGTTVLDRMVKARGVHPAYPQIDEKWLEAVCR